MAIPAAVPVSGCTSSSDRDLTPLQVADLDTTEHRPEIRASSRASVNLFSGDSAPARAVALAANLLADLLAIRLSPALSGRTERVRFIGPPARHRAPGEFDHTRLALCASAKPAAPAVNSFHFAVAPAHTCENGGTFLLGSTLLIRTKNLPGLSGVPDSHVASTHSQII